MDLELELIRRTNGYIIALMSILKEKGYDLEGVEYLRLIIQPKVMGLKQVLQERNDLLFEIMEIQEKIMSHLFHNEDIPPNGLEDK